MGAHVAESLLLLKIALLVLLDLGLVVAYETPINLRSTVVHLSLVQALVMLFGRRNLDAHNFRSIFVTVVVCGN